MALAPARLTTICTHHPFGPVVRFPLFKFSTTLYIRDVFIRCFISGLLHVSSPPQHPFRVLFASLALPQSLSCLFTTAPFRLLFLSHCFLSPPSPNNLLFLDIQIQLPLSRTFSVETCHTDSALSSSHPLLFLDI